MGRILVWWFLASSAFAAATVLVGAAHGVLYLWGRLGGVGGDPTVIPWRSGFESVWLWWTVVYFAWVVPLVILLLLLVRWGSDSQMRRAATPWHEWQKGSVCIVLTAYNDEDPIGGAVEEFRRASPRATVVVVDDNSTDRTAEVARSHGAIVVPETRQGYGFACMRGLRYALESTSAEAVVLAEGDMTFIAEDLDKLLPYLEDCDMVLGTRSTRTLTRPGSQMDWFMAWGNLYLAFLIRLRYWDPVFLGRVQLTDVGCTFRVIRRDALARIVDQLTVGGHYFSPHMIIVALRNQLSVVEVPIKFRARVGVSKGAGGNRWRAAKIGLAMIWEIGTR